MPLFDFNVFEFYTSSWLNLPWISRALKETQYKNLFIDLCPYVLLFCESGFYASGCVRRKIHTSYINNVGRDVRVVGCLLHIVELVF